MSATIAITPATPADVPLIGQLIRELAAYERDPDSAIATDADLHAALFGDHPAAEVLIARTGGEPAGFALFFHNFSTWTGRRGLYLEDLFVRPSARGSGVGRLLLEALARIALDRGCRRMDWAVLAWNDLALGFYSRLGAELQTDWRICRLSGEALERLATPVDPVPRGRSAHREIPAADRTDR
jgi:GNAT superfamily N-acetyltransferase